MRVTPAHVRPAHCTMTRNTGTANAACPIPATLCWRPTSSNARLGLSVCTCPRTCFFYRGTRAQARLDVVGGDELAGAVVERGVHVQLQVELEQAAEALQDAAIQVRVVLLLEQLLPQGPSGLWGLGVQCEQPAAHRCPGLHCASCSKKHFGVPAKPRKYRAKIGV